MVQLTRRRLSPCQISRQITQEVGVDSVHFNIFGVQAPILTLHPYLLIQSIPEGFKSTSKLSQ